MERTYVRPKKSKKCGCSRRSATAGPDKGDRKEKKAKTSKENDDSDPNQVAEEFLAAARAIARCVDLFCNVEKLLRVGFLLQQEQAAENGELEEPEAERESRRKRLATLSTNILDRYKCNYQQLLHLAPGLRPLIADHPKSKQLTQIARKMNAVISGTRSDDATRLKVEIGHYAAPEPLVEALKPTIYNGGSLSRAHMGINHPVLASFLCPISGLEDFKKDPAQARKWMEIGRICMTSINFPVFLWAGKPPASNYNEDAMHEGLFQGYFVERIMCHIFTGPSTALGDDSRATRLCNASLHDMTTVEAEHIAYACVQPTANSNNRAFYYNIIDFIRECEDRDWAEGLLKWWNRALFKNENGREGGTTITDDNGPGNAAGSSSASGSINGLAKMRAQMAARVSAAKGPAGPGPTPTHPTPPQSSITPEPELPPPPIVRSPVIPDPELRPPPIVRSPRPRPLQNAPSPSKSLAPSELTPDEVLSEHGDDLLDPVDVSTTIKPRKKKAPKTKRATGKTAKRRMTVTEESDDDSEDEELPVAKSTKSRGKHVARRK
ncbi:hypothetical protein DFJ58DRAFT_727221 [Suillus subalutaceus]|uniref:uncharacterized protein n=1 Tax=Suillus subalutaceus TaxID=48586 RepID=UPI001B8608F7|nr:uncharacterized protein DFJ58DRAFT_727221 [Suillus subalutaceus]KAG1856385.1 hypothetical protein DFJ58DRAFT_727221 [Suillus subalutaceus]